jgi:flagellar protein FlaH
MALELAKKIISSGNAELDSKMGGGLPAGSLTLIEGGSGSGKSVLSQQILKGALNEGYTAAVFTSENTVKSLVQQMQSIDMDILDFLLLGKCRIYPMELAHLRENAPQMLLGAMKQERSRIPASMRANGRKTGCDLIIIDSFTAAIKNATSAQIISFFEECKRLCASGATVLLIMHATTLDSDLIIPLRSMCDAHLVLRSEQDGQRLVKTLEVAKIRGASSGTGAIVGFDVEPGWGMRVIPISKARG